MKLFVSWGKKVEINFPRYESLQTSFSNRRSRKSRYECINTLKCIIILGKAIISTFQESWKIVNIDLNANSQAHLNILLNEQKDITDNLPTILTDLEKFSKEYESIMCVAGGWMGGSIKEKSIFSQHKAMQQMHVMPSLLGEVELNMKIYPFL